MPRRRERVRAMVAWWQTRLAGAWLLGLLGGIPFALLAALVRERVPDGFDQSVFRAAAGWRGPGWEAVTFFGNGPTVTAIVLGATLLFAARGRFLPDGAAVLGAGAGGWVLLETLKAVFERARPEGATAAGWSFPSGHAFYGVLLAATLAHRLAPRTIPYAVGAGLLVGVSRVVLGQHFLTDVVAGWCLGGLWAWGIAAIPPWRRRGEFPAFYRARRKAGTKEG